ncbi:hypothetical protein NCCP2222_21750 [Sporosarcina sp. NCCP-2222]|uniref:DUF4367 domain-containing protein n=1 Tax=Sporosarcina sp. NCCP-2222 TaxID=2935073 RepID=UPI0020888799|nr:DUF4367 domain-containing protein [Sporosarcina sp. NCCP-2222]GKV56228.1 hypothetical protein NCCP2222_21750 [Sporosarcina sp. NCCP-2222]
MSENEDRDFDDLIREALQEQVHRQPFSKVTIEEAWKRLEGGRNPSPPRRKMKGWGMLLSLAAACMVLFFIWSPGNGIAYGNIVVWFQQIQGSVIQLMGGNSEEAETIGLDVLDATAFQVIETPEYEAEQLSVEEAQSVTDFPIILPVVPVDFELSHVDVIRKQNEMSNEIYLNYTGKDREFTITQLSSTESFSFGIVADRDDSKVEEWIIGAHKGSLITYKNNLRQLIWMTESHYFSIEGNLTEEEIVKIARSM